ncbi:YggS family pyridoxal phosphate-dependent enzyme [Planctomycetota bacterium]
MTKIVDRVNQLKTSINEACARVGRQPSEITTVIVTKSATIEAIRKVLRLGFCDLGENRVQQLKTVAGEIADNSDCADIRWHMIGHLQRNKVKQVLPLTMLIHSVDTLRLAEEISHTATGLKRKAKVLLQVNTSNEPQKYGVPVGAATHLAEQMETLPGIEMSGLMTMAPLTRNKDVVRACFVRARELFLEMQGERIVGPSFTELSMGMSSDYEIAIEEGATILRVGSAIFAG